MAYKTISFILVLFALSCNSSNQALDTGKETTDSIIQSSIIDSSIKFKTRVSDTKSKPMTEFSCMQLVDSVVQGCSLDDSIKQFQKTIDNVENKVITIKIFNINDEGIEVPISWLELDVHNKELRDVTTDPEKPQKLTFDKSFLPFIIKKCIE